MCVCVKHKSEIFIFWLFFFFLLNSYRLCTNNKTRMWRTKSKIANESSRLSFNAIEKLVFKLIWFPFCMRRTLCSIWHMLLFSLKEWIEMRIHDKKNICVKTKAFWKWTLFGMKFSISSSTRFANCKFYTLKNVTNYIYWVRDIINAGK